MSATAKSADVERLNAPSDGSSNIVRSCPQCGLLFCKRNETQIYCSKPCGAKARAKRMKMNQCIETIKRHLSQMTLELKSRNIDFPIKINVEVGGKALTINPINQTTKGAKNHE